MTGTEGAVGIREASRVGYYNWLQECMYIYFFMYVYFYPRDVEREMNSDHSASWCIVVHRNFNR